jgi:hypothetical protein
MLVLADEAALSDNANAIAFGAALSDNAEIRYLRVSCPVRYNWLIRHPFFGNKYVQIIGCPA